MNKNKILSFGIVLAFMFSLSFFTSCGGKKKGYKPVRSHSKMGNSRDKNRHVWGK